MKNNSYVIEDASSKRIYIHTSKTNYSFILKNKCDMLFLVHKTKSRLLRFDLKFILARTMKNNCS